MEPHVWPPVTPPQRPATLPGPALSEQNNPQANYRFTLQMPKSPVSEGIKLFLMIIAAMVLCVVFVDLVVLNYLVLRGMAALSQLQQ